MLAVFAPGARLIRGLHTVKMGSAWRLGRKVSGQALQGSKVAPRRILQGKGGGDPNDRDAANDVIIDQDGDRQARRQRHGAPVTLRIPVATYLPHHSCEPRAVDELLVVAAPVTQERQQVFPLGLRRIAEIGASARTGEQRYP